MFSTNTLQEIYAVLKHNKLRTILTGLSVSWGIFILIILLGSGNGLKNGVSSNFSSRTLNSVTVHSYMTSKPYRGLKSGREISFTDKELNQLEALRPNNIENVGGYIENYLPINYGANTNTFVVRGVMASYNKIQNFAFMPADGRFIDELDVKQMNKVVVLDNKVKEYLFGKKPAINKYVNINSILFKVVGVNTEKERYGDGWTYIPFSTARKLFKPGNKVHSLTMNLKGIETKNQSEDIDKDIKTTLSKTLEFDPADEQAVWVHNTMEEYSQTMSIFKGITIFVSIIGILTLIAGIVGVSNIMLVSVRERTREIGIRKAIGARPTTILRSIVLESMIITGIFGYIGMMAGIGITEIVNLILQKSASNDNGMSVFKDPTVDLGYVFFATIVLVIAGIIAGYLPARKAVRIKPIEAMRES